MNPFYNSKSEIKDVDHLDWEPRVTPNDPNYDHPLIDFNPWPLVITLGVLAFISVVVYLGRYLGVF